MNAFPWLTILGVVPLVGAAVVAAAAARPRAAGQAARPRRLAAHARADHRRWRCSSTRGGPQFQFVERPRLDPRSSASRYAVGVDGIALVLIALATVLVPVVILAGLARRRRRRAARSRSFFALLLVLETMIIGVFAATDVFLFYVFFEAMLIPVYFLIGAFGGPQRVVRRGEVPALQPVRRAAHARRADRAVRRVGATSSARGTFDSRPARRPAHRPDDAEVAVPRLLHRLRDQGAAVAGPHLAARRRRRVDPRHRGAAGRRARQGRHVRDDPLLPAAVPGRLAAGLRAGRAGARRRSASSTARCSRSGRPT